jgi:ABC-type multidrug transport system fused ATPase/permease subunit
MLFDDTITNNIRYGSPNASQERVVQAAIKAHAHAFIEGNLDHGYESTIGEQGGKLSGGQRQRIALARAILKNPPILILDEATSQIDPESESLIHETLSEFIRGRTTLMVTHRLSTLELADAILIMDQGRVVDYGTHEELLARCPTYQALRQTELKIAA